MSRPDVNALKAIRTQRLWFPSDFAHDMATDVLDRLAADPSLETLRIETTVTAEEAVYAISSESRAATATMQAITGMAPGIMVTPEPTALRTPQFSAVIRFSHADIAHELDDLAKVARALAATLGQLRGGETVVLQALLGRRLMPQAFRARPGLRDLIVGKDATGRLDATRHGFEVRFQLGITAADKHRARELADAIIAAYRMAGTQAYYEPERPTAFQASGLRISGDRWGFESDVLAALLGWPIDQTRSTATATLLQPDALADTERTFAITNAPGPARAVGIPAADSLTHTLLMGPNGTGKSTVLHNLIQADAEAGRGLIVLDPKSDLVSSLACSLSRSRRDDVVIVDPIDALGVVGLNPLSRADVDPWLMADSLLSCFAGVWADTWGTRSEEVLGACLNTLTRTPGATLLWLPRLLTDDAFRARILEPIDDPLGVELFWDRYEALKDPQRQTLIAPVLTKLYDLFSRPPLRAMLGQAAPKFSLEQIFTENKIVLVDLNKGRLGGVSRLLGSLIIGSLWPIILRRADIAAEERGITSVYIDEVQDYLRLPGDLADCLAQARGLGVGFTVAHQYRDQLSPGMNAAFDANCRSKIYFSLDAGDAGEVARRAPGLTADDFMLLPKHTVYANVMQHGQSSGWLSARTLPAPDMVGRAGELRMLSRERYARPTTEVEREIADQLGLRSARLRVVGSAS